MSINASMHTSSTFIFFQNSPFRLDLFVFFSTAPLSMEIPHFQPVIHPYRDRPAQYIPGYGWHKNGRRKRVKKPHYHFIWPKDGRNGTKWGRTKDILTGKGPDIHVTVSANKMDYMANRQRKDTWGNHLDLDDRHHDHLGTLQAPWARRLRRDPDFKYDFQTRTYRRPYHHMMTDAIWREGASQKGCPYPRAYRDVYGNWQTDRPRGWDPIFDPYF